METLRAIRKARKRTLTDVAAGAGLSYSTLAAAEVGRINLRFDEARRIADTLGVDVRDVKELAAAITRDVENGT